MADSGSGSAGEKRKSVDANDDEANLPKRPRSSSPAEKELSNKEPIEEEPRDPGKRAYREFSKLLKGLQTLSAKSVDDRDDKQRVQDEVKKLRELCSQKAAADEEPNPWKMIQIELKHTLLNSEKISEEDNVKNFLTGLEDSSASKSDRDNSVFVFLANFATELWYHWKEERQWEWTPDWEFWMPCSETVVSGGQWKGETPAPENVEIIKYLDAIRPVPSDEQYLPTFKFDVFVLFTKLHGLKDSEISEDLRAIVAMLEDVKLMSKNEHIASFKETLQKLKEELVEE